MGIREPEIRREPLLDTPFIATGSEGRRGATLRPDYLAQRGGRYLLVLEAKAPDESVDHPHHVQQAYSYAVHPEVRAPLYAICNGRHLALWRTADPQAKPALRIDLARWPEPFIELMHILSQVSDAPVAADAGHTLAYDYGAIPLPNPFRPERQSVKRHFGVHPYFTRQPYSVVRGHIEHFTRPGDLVLDPFGGSGVTAIEAMMLGRRACHVDINPLSTFIVENLAEPVDLRQLSAAAERICSEYERLEPQDEAAVRDALRIYPRPLPLALPRDADVPTADQLFSDAQTARLGLLKYLIVGNCLQKKNGNRYYYASQASSPRSTSPSSARMVGTVDSRAGVIRQPSFTTATAWPSGLRSCPCSPIFRSG